ncbi:aminoglycoside 3'-phosphotransferase/choline kinase family protein [Bradyrhizobium prioriisuperbiae]|uniref:aminoglycoside phosphotransferase family protein n=1 Tax=Bradyrhizobium prioriisuperbiae TaxID=2854389 RepID=UPI0028E952E2|nr:aminoglycoside 3'-phosphotransferase/choline kinase family protein [Bradyrhizobium prioritasuperba]
MSERGTLRQLSGRLDVPIPEIVLEGEREGWPYLVITRLDGVLGTQAWPQLPEDQKERVLHHIGETIAQVQRAPLGELADLEPAWPAFIARQIAGCRARHERLGLPRKYLTELDDLVAQAPARIPMNAAPVILTGEFIPENILLSEQPGGWQLAGLFDFGDVMTGWGEYDLLGPSSFMTAGNSRRLHSLLRGFGYARADIDTALTRRLMILTLLHRASDLVRQLSIPNWPDKADTLAGLERLLWPI